MEKTKPFILRCIFTSLLSNRTPSFVYIIQFLLFRSTVKVFIYSKIYIKIMKDLFDALKIF